MDLFQYFDDSCYGLRENPKKTWRVSVPDKKQSIDDKENTRHYCGKKSRVSLQCENTVTGFEVLCPIKKKRSKLRYKASGFCSVSNFNSISKFSEFSREEDAALSLVMFSSGFTEWSDFISDFDSSENDSLISKAKAFNGIKLNMNVDSEATVIELENKDCLELGKADTEIKFGEAKFCDQDKELGVKLISCDFKSRDFVLGNVFKKPVIDDDFEIHTRVFNQDSELGENGFIGMEIDDHVTKISEICEIKPKFECKNCSKKFSSFQALGGHRSKKYYEKTYEREISHERKKSKGVHECPICFKVFPSGQALGGHKRAHFNGFSENKNKGPAASVVGFSFEKQFGSGFGLIPCGAKNDCEFAPVVISN